MMSHFIYYLSKFLYQDDSSSVNHYSIASRHGDPSTIQNARSLALSLVGTLQQDFVQWQREQQALQQQQQLVYTFSQPYYSG